MSQRKCAVAISNGGMVSQYFIDIVDHSSAVIGMVMCAFRSCSTVVLEMHSAILRGWDFQVLIGFQEKAAPSAGAP
eukprot:1158863-Pelagomonas_calceolata.AAC.6